MQGCKGVYGSPSGVLFTFAERLFLTFPKICLALASLENQAFCVISRYSVPMITNPTIVYFSGTGNTGLAAEQIASSFKEYGIEPRLIPLFVPKKRTGQARYEAIQNDSDFLIMVFPVHNFCAPGPLFDFIAEQSNRADHGKGDMRRAAVISVSGGGEIAPNRACRARTIKALEAKSYRVVYESMLVMPNNVFIATPSEAAAALVRMLPKKCSDIVDDLLKGRALRTRVPLFDRLFSQLGKFERSRFFQNRFTQALHQTPECNRCGVCANGCPLNNIAMSDTSPLFSNTCAICLRCIYACPRKAISAGYLSFLLVKQGYSLRACMDAVEKRELPAAELKAEIKSPLWSGVRKYLEV